jgi:hypothetical protein
MKRRAFAAGLITAAIARSARAQSVRIALFDGPGIGAEALAAAQRSITTAGMEAHLLAPDAFIAGAASAFDAALFTGGRGSLQGRALGDVGREAVRTAVRAGVGYVGICGGSFLAMQGEEGFHKLAIVAARHATGDRWMRGIGPASVVPEDGSAPVTLHYANGPLMAPEPVASMSPPIVLARFGTEYALPAHDTHAGEMMGAPAVLAARYGEGRIVLFSPNPNLVPAHDELLVRALRSVARSTSTRTLTTWTDLFGA